MYVRLCGFAATLSLALIAGAIPSSAETEITVFAPYRGIETPIARAGSAVTVIDSEQIEQAGALSVADILRAAPGISATSSGGFGSSTNVRIRGGESQHTLVLIDGVPVTDTTDTRNRFDFRTLPASQIDRIEVLRGPQSALYGSDAMGGVINIITKQASRGLNASVSAEGGSYGTFRGTGSVGYGGERFAILGTISHVDTDGFSRTRVDNEDDGTEQWSGFVRGHAQLGEYVRLDASVRATDTEAEYDADPRFGGRQDRQWDTRTLDGHARLTFEGFEGRWIKTVSAYAGQTDNRDDNGTRLRDYEGTRVGLETTSQINFGSAGTLLIGASIEEQTAQQGNVGAALQYDADELYWSLFALHQFSLTPNLHMSAAIRADDFDAAGLFVTGRATAVLEFPHTETRWHASAGTGAKAPTLYQRFGPAFAGPNPNLQVERSFGADLGVTQVLFDGRATVDVTGFYNRYKNLIDFVDPDGFFGPIPGSFTNVARAETYGVEVTANARLIPGQLDGSANYTWLRAEDETTGNRLRRRAEHEAQLTLTYTGIDKLNLSATLNWVGGDRFNDDANLQPLGDYVRVDAAASYQLHEHLEIFARVENLFDETYEEILGFSTPGLSAYAGIRATY